MITTITTLLASATFIWVASIIIIIAMAIFLEHEKEGWATTFFSLGIALLLWNFRSEIWNFITFNPTRTIGFIASYVIIGIVWSFIKWRTYVKTIFDDFKEIKLSFIKTNGEITKENIRKFLEEIYHSKLKTYSGYRVDLRISESCIPNIDLSTKIENVINEISPIASSKKSVIISWISYWPISVIATMLNNPFRRFFEWVYQNLSGYYDKITNSYQKEALGK